MTGPSEPTKTPDDGSELPEFQLDGVLPLGGLAIEASAGTGKTYTLCNLVVRYIAEADIPASSFLIVTFTRAATAELRGRIRKAIIERIGELGSGAVDLPPEQVARQMTNLERSITEYDTITITTIHSFATQTLKSLGSTARFDPPTTFADEDEDTIRGVCSDAILRAAGNGVTPGLLPGIEDLYLAVRTARSTPDVIIRPTDPEDEPTPYHVLASLVGVVLTRLRQQRLMRGTVSFDDVLTGLRDVIVSSEADGLIQSLRSRYRVVMVDEFQDTDPIQWAIFDRVFGTAAPLDRSAKPTGEDDRSLILVGDPKQSIYAFRGADISTYRSAVSSPGMRRVALRTNYRSDGRLLRGLGTLLTGTTYGSDTTFVPVDAAEKYEDRHALDEGRPIVPVRIRLALGDDMERTRNGIKAQAARDAVWGDLVEQVHHCLESVEIPTEHPDDLSDDSGDLPEDGTETAQTHRPTKPSDIAVLVRTGKDALEVQRILIKSGVPAVLSRAGKVLESPAAQQWRWLLDALIRPSDPRRARRFAIGWFGGMTPTDLDSIDDSSMSTLFEQLRSWLEELRASGVPTFVERVLDESGVVPRLLRRPDGDRAVTDLFHIGELLGKIEDQRTPTAAGLLDAIQVRSGPGNVDEADEYARRVETQDPAVQIMTIWVSKGLEFPIVMVPTLFTDFRFDPDVVFDEDGHRYFDVSGSDSSEEHMDIARSRRIEETLRLAYVALTRASHQVTAWWATSNYSPKSPLSRILFARHEDGTIDPDAFRAKNVKIPKDATGAERLAPLVESAEGLIAVDVIGEPRQQPRPELRAETGSPDDGASMEGTLHAATLDRSPDRSSNRWSFTAITAAQGPNTDPDDPTLGDSGAGDEHQSTAERGGTSDTTDTATEATDTDAVPLGWLPAGPTFGTLVHTAYERIDFTDPDVDASIRRVIEDELDWRELDLTPPLVPSATHQTGLDLLTKGIHRTLMTPMGPLFDGRTLDSIGPGDRLSELSFEFLLGTNGSVDPGRGHASDRDIGVSISNWLEDDDPLKTWATQFAEGRFGVSLAGHMTGSIDAVFRVRDGDTPRFIVSDYKTNRLSGPHERPNSAQYGPAPMTAAMADHHYPLQALIYSVALHRYLRGRLSDYDPDIHLGGVAYLFVRGMTGPEAPTIDGHTTGVWSWKPPTGLILELSDLLAGSSAPARGGS